MTPRHYRWEAGVDLGFTTPTSYLVVAATIEDAISAVRQVVSEDTPLVRLTRLEEITAMVLVEGKSRA